MIRTKDINKIIGGVNYIRVPKDQPSVSPFVEKNYDFEDGFYKGEFEFDSPINHKPTVGTPEAYARHRLTAALQACVKDLGQNEVTILDLGCGTLDIARTLPLELATKTHLVNSDISGPWSMGPESALERGVEKLRKYGLLKNFRGFENIEYDFNTSKWPFDVEVFDYVVTNLALCHVAYDKKSDVLKGIYSSLKKGSRVIIGDVFQKDEAGSRFTEAGLRGPEECWGYLSVFTEFLAFCKEAGFKMDDIALSNLKEARNHQTSEELKRAKKDIHATLAINKAVWGIELAK